MTVEPERDPSQVEIGSFYPHPPEMVWRVLTDPALVEQWLQVLPTGFQGARVGTHFIASVPKGEIACEVLAATPGESMTWSWVDLRAPRPARWIASWLVRPQGRGTRLLFTMSGFDIENDRQRMARNAMERGWRQVLSNYGDILTRL
ncbi:SRPBCC domain-containing protein [Tsukamurella sp. 8F]|uniref:SRPBCC family protein n=1 Tax=unclassified Tsukamurella TaxID=2633480 RepID=UPI0023B8A4D7|nr:MULTISPECIES: SRPBCC domain-containing protein [unclassified Tsukamurella]MDF0532372.1 SRPBCC domain-containing protein [Tsukamurella sp. 8J]MDF0589380.1 SRPBCC domain-containing protein [Tsukamurella sp. 8F]